MHKNILVSILENLFCGEYMGSTDVLNEERILLKQSEKSNIMLSIPISKVNYIIEMNGDKHTGENDIKLLLKNLSKEGF